MKFRGNVTAVSTTGESLTVQVQVAQCAASELFGLQLIQFRCREDEAARRTYHVGREVEINVEPRRG